MHDVNLKPAMDDANTIKVINMCQNEKGIRDIFRNRIDRIATAACTWLIDVNGEDVGFVNLVHEKMNYDVLFLDIGIKEKYRNKGICKKALQKVLEKNIDKFIIVETLDENIAMNNAISKVGCELTSYLDRKFYLLQKEKCEEFIDSDGMEFLSEHLHASHTKKRLYNM